MKSNLRRVFKVIVVIVKLKLKLFYLGNYFLKCILFLVSVILCFLKVFREEIDLLIIF